MNTLDISESLVNAEDIEEGKAIKTIDIANKHGMNRDVAYQDFDANFEFDMHKTEVRATPLLAEYSKKSPINAASIKKDVTIISEIERGFGKIKNAPEKQIASSNVGRSAYNLMTYDNDAKFLSNIDNDLTRNKVVDELVNEEVKLQGLTQYDEEDDFASDIPAGVVSVAVQLADAVIKQPKVAGAAALAGGVAGPLGALGAAVGASSAVDNFQITSGSIYKSAYLDLSEEDKAKTDKKSAMYMSLGAGLISGGIEFLPASRLVGKLSKGADLTKIPRSKWVELIRSGKDTMIGKSLITLGKAVYEQGIPEYAQSVVESSATAIIDPTKELTTDVLTSKDALLSLTIGTAADLSFSIAPTVAKTGVGVLRKVNKSLGEVGAVGDQPPTKPKFNINADTTPTEVQFVLKQKLESDRIEIENKTKQLKEIIENKAKVSIKDTAAYSEIENTVASNQTNYVSQDDLNKIIEKDQKFKAIFEKVTKQSFDENKSLYTVTDTDLIELFKYNEEILNNYTIRPEGNTLSSYTGFMEAVDKNKQYFQDVVQKLDNPDLTPEERASINSEISQTLESTTEGVFDVESRQDQPIFPDNVRQNLPEEEVIQIEKDIQESRAAVATSTVLSRQLEVNQIVSLDTRVEYDKRIELVEKTLLEDKEGKFVLESRYNPENTLSGNVIESFKSLDPKFESMSNDLIVDEIKSKHAKPGYSPLAIDPDTLPEELNGAHKIKRLKDKNVFVKGGLDFSKMGQVASTLGYATPYEMLSDLSKTPTRAETFTKLADEQLKTQYELSLNDFGSTKDDFLDAFKNKAKIHLKEAYVVLREKTGTARKLIKRLGRNVKTYGVLESQSVSITRKLKVRELKAEIYRRNQNDFQKKAADSLASGDFLEFFSNKEKQALNALIEGDVQKAAAIINKKMRQVAKLFRADNQKVLAAAGEDYVDLFKSLENAIVFNPSKKPILQEKLIILEPLIAAGYAVPEALIDVDVNDTKVHLGDMSYNQAIAILDTMLNVFAAAKEKQQLTLQEGVLDLLEAETRVADELRNRGDYDEQNYIEFKSWDSRTKGWLRNKYDNIVDRMNTYRGAIRIYGKIVETSLDLGNISGFFAKVLVDPIIAAETDRSNANNTWKTFIGTISESVLGNKKFKEYGNERITIPEFGRKFTEGVLTKGELIGILGQLGSESGRLAVARDLQLDPDEIRNIAERNSTVEDAKVVQSIHNYFDGLMWEKKLELFKKLGLQPPEKVINKPYRLHGVDMKGGYYPITRKQDMVEKARLDARNWIDTIKDGNIVDKLFSSVINTYDGHNLERVKNASSPIDYSLNALEYAVQEMNHNNAFAIPLRDIGKFLSNESIQKDIINVAGLNNLSSMLQHLENVAHSKGEMDSVFEQQVNKDMNKITSSLYVYTMGLKDTTFYKQFLSIFPMLRDQQLQLKDKSLLTVVKYLTGTMFDTSVIQPRNFIRLVEHLSKRDAQIRKQLEDISRNNPNWLNNVMTIDEKFKLEDDVGGFTKVFKQFQSLTLQHLSVAQLYLNVAQYVAAYRMAMDGLVEGVEATEADAEIYATKSVKYSLSDTSKLNEATIYKSTIGRIMMFAGRQMLLSANAMMSAAELASREFQVTPKQKARSIIKAGTTIAAHSILPTMAILIVRSLVADDEEEKLESEMLVSKDKKKQTVEVTDYMRDIGLAPLDYFPITKDIKFGIESVFEYGVRPENTKYPNIYLNLPTEVMKTSMAVLLAMTDDKDITKKDAKKIADVTSMIVGVPNALVGTAIDGLIDISGLPDKASGSNVIGGEEDGARVDSQDLENAEPLPTPEEEDFNLIDFLKQSVDNFSSEESAAPEKEVAKAILRKSVGDISNPEGNKITFVVWADEEQTQRINKTIELTDKEQEDLMVIVDTISRVETANHKLFKNPVSSAKGYHQTIDQTWLSLRKKYPELELEKSPLLNSKQTQYAAYWKYLGENLSVLDRLGQEWSMENIYIVHFLGAKLYKEFVNIPSKANLKTVDYAYITDINPLLFNNKKRTMTKDEFIDKVKEEMERKLPASIEYALEQNLLTSN